MISIENKDLAKVFTMNISTVIGRDLGIILDVRQLIESKDLFENWLNLNPKAIQELIDDLRSWLKGGWNGIQGYGSEWIPLSEFKK